MLRRAFAEAGVPARRARALALLVVSAIEGLLVIARAYRDCGALTTVAVELEALVEAALPPRRLAPRSSGA